ncbi:MAG: signal peptidase II [Candidatus Komeilibacteria bacterium]|nr:signal peptidase II [Candidatus Komeilibacteria bacterium]
MNKKRLGGLLVGLVFLLDRLFKVLSWQGAGSWLGLNLKLNFKMISGLFFGPVISLVLSALIIVVLVYCFWRYRAEQGWLGWLIAGAFSNAVDRLWYGGVIDYWSPRLWPWVFNLADLMIIGSLFWYLGKTYLASRPKIS